MQPDLLPPEEDQQTRADDGLEEAFDKPAIEDFRRSNGPPPKMQQAQKAAGFVAKNKKWIAGGGVGLAIAGTIVLFFGFMMLFKNVHIRNLYTTYRWAQFNRGLNKTLKDQIEYAKTNEDAKPTGTADTTIDPDAPIEDISSKTNGTDVDIDDPKIDDPGTIEDLARDASNGDIAEGNGRATIDAAGSSLDIKPVDESADPNDPEKPYADAVEKNLATTERPSDMPSILDDGLREADAQDAAGESTAKSLETGAAKVLDGGGWRGAFSKASTIVFVGTMYCIARDLFLSGVEQFAKIPIVKSMGAAQEINKTADCQKLGECTANQVAAVANRLDTATDSVMNSCGAARAQQQDTASCKEVDPKFVVGGFVKEISGSGGGVAFNTASELLDPSFLKIVPPFTVGNMCSAVNNMAFQAFLTAGEAVAIVGTGGGWAALKSGVAAGALTAGGTVAGKALIATYIGKVGGYAYKHMSPSDLGNVLDMGNMITAAGTCQLGYCPKASDAQLAQLNRDYRAERIAANSKKSTLEKFFDTSSPDSVTSRIVLNTPATPAAVTGRIKSVLAAIANPIKLSSTLGSTTLALTRPQTAYADANDGGAVYGLGGKINVPPNLLPGASSFDQVVAWGKGRDMSALASKYKKCGGEEAQTYTESVIDEDTTCSWDSMDADGKMYVQYKYAQHGAFSLALAKNNQDNLKGSVSSTTSSSSGGNAEPTNAKKGTDTSNMKCPESTADKGVFKTFNGVNIRICNIGGRTEVNASAAKAFYDMRIAAAAAGVTLDGGGFRSYEEQVRLRKAHCADWQNTPSRNCRPPTAKPGTSNHEEGLAVDYEMTNGVFAWLKANAGKYGIQNLPSERWHWSTTGN